MSPDVDYSASGHRGTAALSVLKNKGAKFRYETLFDMRLGADKRTNSRRGAERSTFYESPSSTGLRRVRSGFLKRAVDHVRLPGVGPLRPERATFALTPVASWCLWISSFAPYGFRAGLLAATRKLHLAALRVRASVADLTTHPVFLLIQSTVHLAGEMVKCPPSWLAIRRSSRRI